MSTFTPGQLVRINGREDGHSRMGLMESPDGSRFADETVSAGDIGHYVGPHSNSDLAELGWVLVSFHHFDRVLWCPLHEEWIEAA